MPRLHLFLASLPILLPLALYLDPWTTLKALGLVLCGLTLVWLMSRPWRRGWRL